MTMPHAGDGEFEAFYREQVSTLTGWLTTRGADPYVILRTGDCSARSASAHPGPRHTPTCSKPLTRQPGTSISS
jgi:hypothetical protein